MYSFAEAGRILGINERAVSGMVKSIKIPIHRHPTNHAAYAIDDKGLKILRKRLRPVATSA